MRIKEIRCEQFAGLQDKNYSFNDGLNLVVGDNETGKSTLIDLLYYLFFQDANIDGRRDKEFKDRYFPKSTGALQGDTIDGAVHFETDEGTYKLVKEWTGRAGVAKLTLPDGTTIRRSETVRDVLIDLLGYGKGIYDELVFPSQKRDTTIMRALLNGAKSDTAAELGAAVTKAVLETGGIAVDRFEAELDERIEGYEGNWDFEANMPQGGRRRGINNPWKKGNGKILDAYYRMERIDAQMQSAKQGELAVEQIERQIRDTKELRKRKMDHREEFLAVRALLRTRNLLTQRMLSAQTRCNDMRTALCNWPQLSESLERARLLKVQLSQTEKRELFQKASAIVADIENKQARVNQLGVVQATDVKSAESLYRDILRDESRLKGINLKARIRRTGQSQIDVFSVVSGEKLPLSGDEITITEAVDIRIPGVANITLMPKGTDVDAIQKRLQKNKTLLEGILKTYLVASVEELKEKQENAERFATDVEKAQDRLHLLLGNVSWEQLREEALSLPDDLPASATVKAEIDILCQGSVDTFIGRASGSIEAFTTKYQSVTELSGMLEKETGELQQIEDELNEAQKIPDQFLAISDPDQYEADLKRDIDQYDTDLDSLRGKLSVAEKTLGDQSAEEYAEEYRQALEEFETLRADCRRWQHIRQVFRQIKNENKENPMLDIEQGFRSNLLLISGGNMELGDMDEKLRTSVLSGKHPLTAEILSEGTKGTISLAFRLAVLEHLYPNGGCVAVFDDPFTEMDPSRTEVACRLLQRFAEKNQVIFVTCDGKYRDLLKGTVVEME